MCGLSVEGGDLNVRTPVWSGNYGPPLSPRLKRTVLREHAGICHWCGKPGGDEVDHVVNRRSGGSDDPSNLRPIHKTPCHTAKTQAEAAAARAARRKRKPPKHPGIA